MKKKFLVLLVLMVLLLTVTILTTQPRDESQLSATNTNSANHWYNWLQETNRWDNWLQDKRIPPLAERISAMEVEQLKIPILEEQLQRIATIETRLNQLALLEKRIGLLENGSVLAKKTDAEWTLTDMFSRLRQHRQAVVFSQDFPVPPKIMLGITMLDLPEEKVRFLARAEEIDTHGFTLVFESRSDSRIEEVQVDWLAFSVGSFSVGSSTTRPAP